MIIYTNIPTTLPLKGGVHFLGAPLDESIYSRKLLTKKDFFKEFNPYSPDVSEKERAYSRYKEHEQGQHAVCIYEGHEKEGKLIWNGDRRQH